MALGSSFTDSIRCVRWTPPCVPIRRKLLAPPKMNVARFVREREELGLAAGMDAYLSKPIQPQDLDEIPAQRLKSVAVSEPQEGKPVIS